MCVCVCVCVCGDKFPGNVIDPIGWQDREFTTRMQRGEKCFDPEDWTNILYRNVCDETVNQSCVTHRKNKDLKCAAAEAWYLAQNGDVITHRFCPVSAFFLSYIFVTIDPLS